MSDHIIWLGWLINFAPPIIGTLLLTLAVAAISLVTAVLLVLIKLCFRELMRRYDSV